VPMTYSEGCRTQPQNPEGCMEITSPLGTVRRKRHLTLEEAAARAHLEVDDVRALEENRIYRFPSVDEALATTLVYATALGVSEREALELAGMPVPTRARWNVKRWIVAAVLSLAVATLFIFALSPGLVPYGIAPTADSPAEAPPKLPPPWEIRVDVYNGTGIPNAATKVANEVGGPLAYRIGTVKNAKRTDYIVTRVYYPPGATEIAERLAHQLGVGVTALPSGGDRNRLVVIVGSDRARGT
jgi:LytR cell envelope-related transcriptional attenuator